jgi:hypothetical protein
MPILGGDYMAEHIVKNIKAHIPSEQYGFVECEIEGINTLSQVLELAKNLKCDAAKAKYGCEHMFAKPQEGVSKKTGRPYAMLKCPECPAICFKNGDGTYGSWQYPASGKGV